MTDDPGRIVQRNNEALWRRVIELERYVDNVLKPREVSLRAGLYAIGEIWVSDQLAGGTVILPGVGYTKYTDWQQDGQEKNCTNDAANDKITITKTGIYRVDFVTSFKSNKANINILAAAFLNGVEQDQLHYRRKIATANDEGSASGTGYIDVTTVPWDLDLRFRHDDPANVTVTVTYGNMNIFYAIPT